MFADRRKRDPTNIALAEYDPRAQFPVLSVIVPGVELQPSVERFVRHFELLPQTPHRARAHTHFCRFNLPCFRCVYHGAPLSVFFCKR